MNTITGSSYGPRSMKYDIQASNMRLPILKSIPNECRALWSERKLVG